LQLSFPDPGLSRQADPCQAAHLPVLPEDMDVSKNTGTPKWMVKIMENPIKMG